MSTIANEQQSEYWNEDAGPRWVEFQDRLDKRIEGAATATISAANVSEIDHILDIGCGCGATSIMLAHRAAQGTVTGADLSKPMLARARERAEIEGITNATFVQADVQSHDFPAASFDLAFSRFGVMFFADPVVAFANVRRALKPSGRLCFACWRALQENPWIAVPVMAMAQHVELPPPPEPGEPGPFSLHDPDRIREILTGAGFTNVQVEPYDEAGDDSGETVDDTIEFLQKIGPLSRTVNEIDEATKEIVFNAIRDALNPFEKNGSVQLARAMWIVTATNVE